MSGELVVGATGGFNGAAQNPRLAELRGRIRDQSAAFAPAAQRVCRLLAELTPEELVYMTAAELGRRTRTSNATVVRTLQALGYEGLADVKAAIAGPATSEIVSATKARFRVESTGDDLVNVWDLVTAEAIARIELLRESHSPELFVQAVQLLADARTVLTYGFGAGALTAEHLARQLRRIGLPSRQLLGSGFQLADEMLSIERGCVLVLFVAGRFPSEVEVMLERAQAVGAKTIMVTHELVENLEVMVTMTLHAPNTTTGLTAEALSSITVADALAQGLAALDAEQTVQTSHNLGTLRRHLGF
jgi:DNA-binding MurR/RpiR family transcriptional regulator